MKVSILDDCFDTLRTEPCFENLAGNDVTAWNDHVPDTNVLADRVDVAGPSRGVYPDEGGTRGTDLPHLR